MSNIALGTVQFGLNYGINNNSGKPSISTSLGILKTAYDHGIRMLDTAEAYGDSQKIIGKYHNKYPNCRFRVITKYSKKAFGDTIVDHINNDLKELKSTGLHGYMFHNLDDFFKNEKYFSDLKFLKTSNLLKKIGISIYLNDEIDFLIQLNKIRYFDFIQMPFNLLDNLSQRGDYLNLLREFKIEIHTRSVFLQGLFFKPLTDLPSNLKSLKPYLESIRNIAQKTRISLEQMALSYVLQQTYIDNVIIGVDSIQQLIKNVEMSKNLIEDKTINAVNKIYVKEAGLLNPKNW